jgi:predicted metal-dependent phosphoesterase TrpH
MAVDLHTHSTASDGSDDPEVLVEKAATAGLSAIALTDHDTQEGIGKARAVADRVGIELIPGTELSLEYLGGMHLVVLWLEPGPGPLQDKLPPLQEGRTHRNATVLAALTDHGMPITMEEVLEQAGGGSVGRPHIAAVMVNRGYVESIPEAFELWLSAGKPGYADRPRLSPRKRLGSPCNQEGCPYWPIPTPLASTGHPKWQKSSIVCALRA